LIRRLLADFAFAVPYENQERDANAVAAEIERHIVGKWGAAEFDAMIEELNQTYAFKIAKMATGLGPSDHASFYRQKVPVLFFYTGDHPDYHKPTDDVERINVDGMLAITDFVTDIVSRLDDAATRPSYRETTRGRRNSQEAARPYLGCVPDASRQADGVGVLSVAADSPAAQAGLRAGDVLVKLGDTDVRTLEDLNRALRQHKPGDSVTLGVQRGAEQLSVTAVLGEPR
jgi:membrane-associated protease RseP (regulator of RpoE activity)